jgi:hypothetical protein
MNVEQVAQRYSSLDGFRLADYCTVALPFWFVAYEAQVLAEKPIPLLDEFLLRALRAHVNTVTDLGAFLGVGEKITIRRLGRLHAAGYIKVVPAQFGAPCTYALTVTGETSLRDAASIQPKEQKIVVAYDGVAQRIIPRELENSEVLSPQEIKKRGWWEIPAFPENRPPPEDVFNQLDLNHDLPADLREKWDIHHILSARKSGQLHRRAREAYMLIYRSETDPEQVAARFFNQHGRPMSEIDRAFLQHEGAKRLKIAQALHEHRESLQKELAQDESYQLVARFAASHPADEVKAVAQLSTAARLGAELSDKEQELRREQKDPVAPQAEIDQLRADVSRLKQEKITLESVRLPGVRRIGPQEHPRLLKQAIAEARQRLVLVSPWINDGVMAQHLRGLEDLVQRKTELFIGYGISERPEDDPKAGKDEATIEFFQRLKSRFPRQVHFVRLGDTHAKVLIKDSDFVVVGSFNWMSFRGTDRGFRPREEQSLFCSETAVIEDTFTHYLRRFATYDKYLAARVSGLGST